MGSDMRGYGEALAFAEAKKFKRDHYRKIKEIEGMLYKAKADVFIDSEHPFADIMAAAEIDTLERVLVVLGKSYSDEKEKAAVIDKKLARESWG